MVDGSSSEGLYNPIRLGSDSPDSIYNLIELGTGAVSVLIGDGAIDLGISSTITLGTDGLIQLTVDSTGDLGISSTITLGTDGLIQLTVGSTGDLGISSTITLGTGGLIQLTVGSTGDLGISSTITLGTDGMIIYPVSGLLGISSPITLGLAGSVLLGLETELSIFHVFIKGKNVGDAVLTDTITVDRQVNFAASSTFRMNRPSFVPDVGMDVQIYAYDRALGQGLPWGTNEHWKIFGGAIDKAVVKKTHVNDSQTWYDISCVDYAKVLARRLVTAKFDTAAYPSVGSILSFLATNYLTPEGVSWIDEEPSIYSVVNPGISFSNDALTNVMDKLAELAGLDWQVDIDKGFRMLNLPNRVQAAPFSITEQTTGPNSLTWADLEITRDRGLYRNVQFVRTNFAQTVSQITLNYTLPTFLPSPPSAALVSWKLDEFSPGVFRGPYLTDWRYNGRINRILSISLNGSPVAFYTLIDEAGSPTGEEPPSNWKWVQTFKNNIDLAFNMLAVPEASWPVSGDTLQIVIEVNNDIPQPVMLENTAEIAARIAIEGGTGRYETSDELLDVAERATVLQYAQNLLDRFSKMGMEVSYRTFRFLLEPGQSQTCNLPSYGWFTEELMKIESVQYRELQKTLMETTVKVSNAFQQRDALTAMYRLIKRMKKANVIPETQISFDIAKDISGITNPGLIVGQQGNEFVVRLKQIALKDAIIKCRIPPTGSGASFQVRRNGSALFTGGLSYPEGATAIVAYSNWTGGSAPTLYLNDVLTLHVLTTGSIDAGSNFFLALRGTA